MDAFGTDVAVQTEEVMPALQTFVACLRRAVGVGVLKNVEVILPMVTHNDVIFFRTLELPQS